ncbi:alpha/beta-hydrolase [Cylindrobasidium torrendii FP15055 ss-10]|uniref:Alpha/beta-hydrolase n=1 Tax=Cylindrobasidium torrendii FP15055 ss-10 TaxID=1314674 RepID=A0A0D7B1P0_9AGAR|nr:alpha/beta-hydrolase [Cylindrobasidium torrendii FP15055 ss-10]
MMLIELPHGVQSEVHVHSPQHADKLAVLLHPHGFFGGQMRDPVLASMKSLLDQHRYHSLTYNRRGVGSSTGWPSMSGAPEANDLKALVDWAVGELGPIDHILIVGYSQGALVSSLFGPHPTIPTSYLFLSYPLGVRGVLTLFRGKSYEDALNALIATGSQIFIVYGTSDQFTGVAKYDDWASQFSSCNNVLVKRVEGADHFWRGSLSREVQDVLNTWLQGVKAAR